jgi:RNA polymerase sigma factor (sigma-70 family)
MNMLLNSDGEAERNARLKEIFQTYKEPVRRFFLRRTRNPTEADDLTQDLFARIVRKGSLENVDHPEGFVFQSAMNLLRDRSRRQKTSDSFLGEITASDANKVEDISPERVLNSKQSLAAALSTLDSLEAKTRNIFILNRMEGLKYSEIAKLYGISVSAVEKHISKCLSLLMKQARDNWE